MVVLSCAHYACTNVNGGAVELSWQLEDFAGATISGCQRTMGDTGVPFVIDQIQLRWQVGADPTTAGSRDFACTTFHGLTGFEVPPGSATLSVEPQCLGGTPVKAEQFTAPAPIQRTISVGDVVELHAVVIAVDTNTACR